MMKRFYIHGGQRIPRLYGMPMAVVALLFCATVVAQRVSTTNSKGTMLTTGNVVTEGPTAPSSPAPIHGDIWYDTSIAANIRTNVWDGNTWKEISPAYIRPWVSNTNGGSYATNDLVAHNGILYKNLTGTNTDTAPNADTTNWETLITDYLGSTVHISTASQLADAHRTRKIHIEPNGILGIVGSTLSDGFSTLLINHSGTDSTINFTNFTGVFELNTSKSDITADGSFGLAYLESAILTVTESGVNKYLNITRFGSEVLATPLWKSDTNGGAYTTNDIVNHGGILYKNLTGTNTDTAPNADTTNWERNQDGIENWVLTQSYRVNDVVVNNNKIYQANGTVAANTAFTLGTTGATWKEISRLGSSVSNEQSFEDTAGTYFYVSLLVDNAWKVIRYKLDDVNDETTATETNNASQTTQPTTLAECEALTFI